MHDTPLGWVTYLDDLERQAIRLRRRTPVRPRIPESGLAAVLAALRATAAAALRHARTAVDSGRARG